MLLNTHIDGKTGTPIIINRKEKKEFPQCVTKKLLQDYMEFKAG
jgi:hypothetical protein